MADKRHFENPLRDITLSPQTPPNNDTANTGPLRTAVARALGSIARITGKTSWWDAPDISLADAKTHQDTGSSAHGGLYERVRLAGVDLPKRRILDVVGAGASVTDDPAEEVTTLSVSGGSGGTLVSVTGAYTVASGVGTVLANATSAGFTVALPTAVGIPGRAILVKKIDSSANAVTIDPFSTQTIEGAGTVSLTTQWQSLFLVSDGANWIIAGPGASGGGSIPPEYLTQDEGDARYAFSGSVGGYELPFHFAANGTRKVLMRSPVTLQNHRRYGTGVVALSALKEQNLVSPSDFPNAAWTKDGLSVASNAATDPDGATTADKLTPTSAYGEIYQDKLLGANLASKTFVWGVWLKVDSAHVANLFAQAVGGAATERLDVQFSLTTSWKYFEMEIPFSSSRTDTSTIRCAITPDPGGGTAYVYAYGATLKLKVGSFAYPYSLAAGDIPIATASGVDGDFLFTVGGTS